MRISTLVWIPFLVSALAQPLASASAPPPSLGATNSRIADTIQKLQDNQLWIGGSVTLESWGRTSTSIYGTRELGKPQAPSTSSHFEIGSMSKSFTGILLEWVVQTHPYMHLDDTIETFLPQLKGHFTGKITLRQLATHTAGLPDGLCIPKTPTDPENPWAGTTAEQLMTFLQQFNPGGTLPFKASYSNVGFITLGYVLSQVTGGRTYSQMVRGVITRPLGMRDTFVNVPGMTIHDYLPGFDVIGRQTEHWNFSEVSAPAGGIVSTPDDMAKYLHANLAPTDTPLGRAIQASHRDKAGWDNVFSPGDTHIFKNGGTYGFSSVIYMDPLAQLGVVILSNTSPVYSASLAVYPVFWPWYFGPDESFPDLAGVPLPADVLASYAGTYTTNDADSFPGPVTISVSKNLLQMSGGGAGSGANLRFQAVSSAEFAATDGDQAIGSWAADFQSDAAGRVTGFTFVFNDGSGHAPDAFVKVK